jgi:hypothetical protein
MPESSPWWEFEQFVLPVLQETPGVQIPGKADTLFTNRRMKDRGFDIEAVRDGHPLLVEIKSQPPETSARLNDAARQLRDAQRGTSAPLGRIYAPSCWLSSPGVVSQQKRQWLRHDQVEIWDGRELRHRARQFGIRVPDFVAALEGEESAEDREPARELTERLASIRPGRLDAAAYEKWCEDVLNSLFCPPLNLPIVQYRDDMGANRRDLIMPNYATRGFGTSCGTTTARTTSLPRRRTLLLLSTN